MIEKTASTPAIGTAMKRPNPSGLSQVRLAVVVVVASMVGEGGVTVTFINSGVRRTADAVPTGVPFEVAIVVSDVVDDVASVVSVIGAVATFVGVFITAGEVTFDLAGKTNSQIADDDIVGGNTLNLWATTRLRPILKHSVMSRHVSETIRR
ncbi:MAG: hypothetical protein M1335_02145 [Chloroflexi bacterium]|nr:hypothetical protein [Chloroflexota bacterium]